MQCQAVKVDTTIEEVKAWIATSQRDATWLILMFHQIDHEGRAWSTTPEMLGAILGHVKESGAAIVTVAEGLKK